MSSTWMSLSVHSPSSSLASGQQVIHGVSEASSHVLLLMIEHESSQDEHAKVDMRVKNRYLLLMEGFHLKLEEG